MRSYWCQYGRVPRNSVTTYYSRQTFFTILRLSFCVIWNSFNFIEILKNKNVRAQFSKSYIPLHINFFNWWIFDSVQSHKYFVHCGGSIVIFDGCWIKLCFKTNISCIKVFNSEENSGTPCFFYIKSCSCWGIIKNSQWYEDKLWVSYF